MKHPLLIILLVSVLLRVGVAFAFGDAITETRGGTHDQVSYDALAQRVATGHGFSFATDWWPGVAADQPTAFWSYLYTLFLAAIYTVFGHHPLAARLIQAALAGVLMPWLTYRLARRAFVRDAVALIAAASSALYLYFITYAASLMTEALYITAILWTLDAAMRLAEALDGGVDAHKRLRWGIELGLAMGITLLLRQVIGVFLAVLALWFLRLVWRRSWGRRALAPLALAAGVTFFLCLPFILRNYQAFGVLSLPNTNVGINFFWSNHPVYGTRFEAVLSPEHGVSYQELIPPELHGLSDPLLDRALLARGIQFVLDDPVRYGRLCLSRIPIYFQFWPTPQSTPLSNAARLFSFGLFLPFMLYGVYLEVKAKVKAKADEGSFSASALTLILAFIVVYTAVHLASWANVRYRLPVDAALLLFAGLALADLGGRLTARRMAHSEQ